MRRRATSLVLLLLVSSCGEQIPEYSNLLETRTREEMRDRFGAPDSIRSGKYQVDVVSRNEPQLLYTEYEYWEYLSMKDGEIGTAFFSFYFNEDETVELLGHWNWLSEEAIRQSIEIIGDWRKDK